MKQLFIFLALLLSIKVNAQSTTFQWAKSTGGKYGDNGQSIAVDASGNVYTTGTFQGTVDFDPNSGVVNLTSNGIGDIFISKLDANGNLLWVKGIGSTLNDFRAAMTIDALGNVYITGDIKGITDFDPGVTTFTLVPSGSADIYILKLDSNGNFLWAKQISTTASNNAYGVSIVADASGNTYSTGQFDGIVDFDPNSGIFNLNATGSNIYVLKLDANGNFVWAKQLSGGFGGGAYVNSIGIDVSNNVYTTGNFYFNVDFDPNGSVINLTSAGSGDVFISKLDASGNFVYVKQIGGTGNEVGWSVALDASGNVYTTGWFGLTVDFNPSAGVFNLTSTGFSDTFILKLDINGNFVWVKQIGGGGYQMGVSIALDVLGNIYTTGDFNGLTDFDPNAGIFNLTNISSGTYYDIFISKLDPNGNFLDAKQLGGTNAIGWPQSQVDHSITLDALGNIYTTGSFHGSVDFDPDAGVFNLTADSLTDVFVLKLNQNFAGINENIFQNDFKIFPNPVTGFLKIKNTGNTKIDNVVIYDIIGIKVLEQKENTSQINIQSLEKGMYQLIISSEGKSYASKFIKE